MKRKFIKMICLAMTMLLVLTLVLAGCGSKTEEKKDTNTKTNENVQKEEKKSDNTDSTKKEEAKKVVIKIGHVGAPVSPQQDIGEMFAKYVSEKTQGTVEIKLYGSSQLGSEKDLQQGVKAGTIDGLIAGSWERFISWTGVLQAPLIYRDLDHFTKVFSGPVGQELMATIEKELDVKPLFIAPHGSFRYITNSVRPIKSPADMKGLKLRDPDVPAYSAVTKALGATPVPMDFAELYVALDRKVVDGQHNPTSHIYGSKFYEVQKYLSMVPYGIPPHTVTLSKKAWNRLSEQQQKAVLEAAQETAVQYPVVAKKNNEELLEKLKDKIEILRPEEIDLEAFQKIFKEVSVPELNKVYGEQGAKYLKSILETK
jgi:C4-dicarboxylate-binding protein DctP